MIYLISPVEIIMDRHGKHASATYIDGNLPINRIFATASVNIVQGGYTSFADGVQSQQTDHQCLWVDISIQGLFWRTPSQEFAPTIVNKFNTNCKQFVIKNRLAHKTFQLERAITFPFN